MVINFMKHYCQKHSESGAIIFTFPVRDPNRYGVAEISENNIVIGIEENHKTKVSICCYWTVFL